MILRRPLAILLVVALFGATPAYRKGFREVPVGVTGLGTPAPDESNISTFDGLGAVRMDGTQINVCVSFQNNSTKTAALVHYEYSLYGATGAVIATIPYDIKGTFSPGIPIRTVRSFDDLVDYNANYPSVAESNHCLTFRPPNASAAILATHLVTYSVTHVEYTDGTSWTGAGVAANVPKMLPGAEQGSAMSDGFTISAYPLEASPPDGSNIEVLRGFVSVDQPRGAVIDVCVAFRNTASKDAKLVNVTYYLVGPGNAPLGELQLTRKGTFSQGTEIGTFSFLDLVHQRPGMNAGWWDNCVFHETKTAPFFNPGMQFVRYKVTHVEYADGTSWP